MRQQFDNEYIMYVGGAEDEFGNPVKRTKGQYPYSYDGFVTWRNSNENIKSNGTIYCDRLWQWDYDKYNKLSNKYFGNEGQYFFDRKHKDIEAFLREWTNDIQLELTLVMEYCNVSTGYPVWRFDYNSKINQ